MDSSSDGRGGRGGRGGGRGGHHTSQVSGVGMKHPDHAAASHSHLAAFIKSQEYRLNEQGAVQLGDGSAAALHAAVTGGAIPRIPTTAASNNDAAYSSSSEGFCDSDRRESGAPAHDSDSDLGAELDATPVVRHKHKGGLLSKSSGAAASSSSPELMCLPDVPLAKIVKATDSMEHSVRHKQPSQQMSVHQLPIQQQAAAAAIPQQAGAAALAPAAARAAGGDASESDEYQVSWI